MLRSNRGAARVSVIWIIVVGVLFLVGIAFAFVASSDLATERAARERATVAAQDAAERVNAAADEARAISRKLGWFDEADADPRSDLALVEAELANMRGVFTDLTDADDRVDEVLPKVRAAYAARQREIQELRTRIKDLEAEAAARTTSIQTITSEKDARIAELTRQLADETQAAEARIADLEQRRIQAESQLSDRDNELRRVQNEAAIAARDLQREMLTRDTRITELSSQLRFQRAPFSGYPDGQVLSVSDRLPLAYIDIGANDRVVQGLRFRVESGGQGDRRLKAWAEVTRVEAGMAEVALTDVVDPFDPVAPGDVVLNPVFDPKGGRNAILVGRFSGQFSRTELAQLLENMGVHVQEELDLTTTFMIVGAPLFNDPETGEPLDDPLEPSDLQIYKDAEAQGVQIIPLAEIRDYFRPDVLRTTQR